MHCGCILYIITATLVAEPAFCMGPPPPPTPIEPGGTYARSPSPEPPISGIGIPLAMTKNTPFSGLSRKSYRDYCQIYPLSRENGNIRMRPPHAFEWGRGRGAGQDNQMHQQKLTRGKKPHSLLKSKKSMNK